MTEPTTAAGIMRVQLQKMLGDGHLIAEAFARPAPESR